MEEMTPADRRVLNLALDAGHILLENGAEIARVEETMEKICTHYGVETGEFFVLSNGIFTTAGHTTDKSYARVQHIPVKGTQMDRIVAVNQLSREIVAGKYEHIEDAEQQLEAIRRMPSAGLWKLLLASGAGSGFFCVLFGGGVLDCVSAFIAGFLLYIYVLKVGTHLSKIVNNIIGGMLVVLISLASYHVGLGISLSPMISGSIMPLVPGVAFTNGIRDIIFGDTNSGINRVVEALLIAAAVALGTAVAWNLTYTRLGIPDFPQRLYHSDLSTCLASFVACLGFVIIFNIHGYGNMLCAVGSALTWAAYCIGSANGLGYFTCCLIGTMVSAAFAEVMARIRKYPAISYLIIAVLPLIPGSSIYYTALAAVQGNMDRFVYYGTETLGTAGAMAVGILLVSTGVRIWNSRQIRLPVFK